MVSGLSAPSSQNYVRNFYLPNYEAAKKYYNPVNSFNNRGISPQQEKVGFWEGLKTYAKGLLKPIKNMIMHPIKTALFMAGSAALIIGTGGAAIPFMIGAGVVVGGYQVAKGAFNAITSDNRYETLAALESMGEGTFTLGASVCGAKAYAASTSAGSATAAAASKTTFCSKTLAYTKGLANDTWTTLQAVPQSLKSSASMIMSGEFTGNLQSVAASTKLAAEHRALAKLKKANSPEYKTAKAAYDVKLQAYKTKYGALKPAQIADNYTKLYEKYGFDCFNENGLRFSNSNLAKIASVKALKNGVLNATNEELIALGLNSSFEVDPEVTHIANTYTPYFLTA